MKFKNRLLGAAAGAAMLGGAQTAFAMDEITVAYFLEWPMPFQYAKVMGTYDEALGVKVNWVSFDTGTAMSAAMASGDVQIAVSQGIPPFVVATSAGQDLQVVDVAVSYSENDNCFVAEALEIDKDSAKELEGKKVGVPIGTAAHYGFLKQMSHFGVDITTMEIVDMAPPEGAAAFSQGNLDMVCGFGASVQRMAEHGNVLLTGAEKEEVGILVFDVTSVPAAFASENEELVAKFLKVTADANAAWNAGENTEEYLEAMAKDAGMELEATREYVKGFSFPSVEDQLSEKWLGGGVQEFMLGVANVFKDAGSIPEALDTYEDAVNAGPLTAASGM